MELLGKLTDAASMFWQALDERERLILAYAGLWAIMLLCLRARQVGRDQLKREIREELAADAGRS